MGPKIIKGGHIFHTKQVGYIWFLPGEKPAPARSASVLKRRRFNPGRSPPAQFADTAFKINDGVNYRRLKGLFPRSLSLYRYTPARLYLPAC
jgi:hypothetical protein